MSRPNNNTPYNPYGPATGAVTPDPKNEVLTPDSHYTGKSTPGTTNHAYPQHVAGGTGHEDCDHE